MLKKLFKLLMYKPPPIQNEIDIKLEDKMHSIFYIKKEKENDILMLKDEITRLSTKVKSITNVITKVKEIGLDAVLEFGANGKSGNKTLKYPDLSIWTVNRESLVVPEDLSEALGYGKQLTYDGEEELAAIDNINASTVIEFINNQLQAITGRGQTVLILSLTYQPMKKFYEDATLTRDVEAYYNDAGFASFKVQNGSNTEPYLEINI